MVLSGPHIAALATAALAAGAALGFLCAQRLQPPPTASTAAEPVRERGGFPKRLILVRHGESEGNNDPLLYCHVPDNAMHLTTLGYEQAVAAGRSIKQIIGDESVVRPCLCLYLWLYSQSVAQNSLVCPSRPALHSVAVRAHDRDVPGH